MKQGTLALRPLFRGYGHERGRFSSWGTLHNHDESVKIACTSHEITKIPC